MRQVTTGEFEGGSVFIDGDWRPLSEGKISLFDWGFTRSDATYDVASAWHGRVLPSRRPPRPLLRQPGQAADDDPVRARRGARDPARLRPRRRPARRLRRDGVHARRAAAAARAIPRLATNRFYAYALPFVWIAPPEKQQAGIDLHVSNRLRIAPEAVDPTIKNYHWIDLVLSLFDAYDRGADTSCVVDADGNVAEGPGFNVFLVDQGVVRTPERGVLEGISRRTVIELCGSLGDPAAHRGGPGRRPRPRRRGVPELDRRRRAADREGRRPCGAGRISRTGHEAAAGRLLGAARRPPLPRPGRLLSRADRERRSIPAACRRRGRLRLDGGRVRRLLVAHGRIAGRHRLDHGRQFSAAAGHLWNGLPRIQRMGRGPADIAISWLFPAPVLHPVLAVQAGDPREDGGLGQGRRRAERRHDIVRPGDRRYLGYYIATLPARPRVLVGRTSIGRSRDGTTSWREPWSFVRAAPAPSRPASTRPDRRGQRRRVIAASARRGSARRRRATPSLPNRSARASRRAARASRPSRPWARSARTSA